MTSRGLFACFAVITSEAGVSNTDICEGMQAIRLQGGQYWCVAIYKLGIVNWHN